MQSNLLLKQSQCWTQLIGQLTMALKVSSRFSLTLNFTVFECLREGTRRCRTLCQDNRARIVDDHEYLGQRPPRYDRRLSK